MSNFVCVRCPMGCRLSVEQAGDEVVVSGNRCNRGRDYGRQEFISPKRTVTSLVKVVNGNKPVVPVKTTAPVYKTNIKKVLKIIGDINLVAPVPAGTVIYENIEQGINLVTTSSVDDVKALQNE